MPASSSAMRSFSPSALARLECAAWTAYYVHDWKRVLTASLGLVREGFGLRGLDAVRGAWWVLRANQKWAPYPDNDPDAARACMARFYGLVAQRGGSELDAVHAARLDVEWWRAHRELQHGDPAGLDRLTDAVAGLYAYSYRVDVASVRDCARLRAEAMRVCDAWVAAGCDPRSPDVGVIESLLVRSYLGLRVAVA